MERIADFNGDGSLDLAVANSGSNTIQVFLGNGDGTFQSQPPIGTGALPQGVVIGDFNQDGRLDLAVPNANDNTVSILLQEGTVGLSRSGLNFGIQVAGTRSAAQYVTLTNAGTGTLTISSIAITGTNSGDFAELNNCGTSVPPGGHCTIGVTFKPTQLGPRTASVTITDNAVGSPRSVSLNGTGVISGPDATLSPTSLSFATQLVRTTSPAQSVTLANYGTETLDITSIVASGDFSQTHRDAAKSECPVTRSSYSPVAGPFAGSGVSFTGVRSGGRTGPRCGTSRALGAGTFGSRLIGGVPATSGNISVEVLGSESPLACCRTCRVSKTTVEKISWRMNAKTFRRLKQLGQAPDAGLQSWVSSSSRNRCISSSSDIRKPVKRQRKDKSVALHHVNSEYSHRPHWGRSW